jgi:CheY-like chemotaxis protein
LFRVLIIGEGTGQVIDLSTGLIQQGLTCSISTIEEDAVEQVIEQAPDLVLLDMTGPSSSLI